MASSDTTCMLLEGGVLMMEVSGDYYKRGKLFRLSM